MDINWELIVTVVLAYLGFREWRNELIGKRKAELAEEAIVYSLKARNAIREARSIWGHSGEGKTRPLGPDETSENRNQHKDSLYAHIERLEKYNDVFDRLSEIKYLYQAYFGEDTEHYFSAFNQARNRIYNAVSLLMQTSRTDTKLHKKLEKDRWLTPGEEEDDEIENLVNTAVENIEKISAPYLRSYFSRPFKFIPSIFNCNKKT